MNLEILNKNFKGSQWANARIENEELVADHYGELLYFDSETDMTKSYEGTTTCFIRPTKELFVESKIDSIDKNGWVKENLDFCPVDMKFNY